MSWTAIIQIPRGMKLSKAEDVFDSVPICGEEDNSEVRDAAYYRVRDMAVSCIGNGLLGNLSDTGFIVEVTGHTRPETPCQLDVSIRQANL